MKTRIYIDTYVVGGNFDKEFMEATKLLFDKVINKIVIFVVSELLKAELFGEPYQAKEYLVTLPSE